MLGHQNTKKQLHRDEFLRWEMKQLLGPPEHGTSTQRQAPIKPCSGGNSTPGQIKSEIKENLFLIRERIPWGVESKHEDNPRAERETCSPNCMNTHKSQVHEWTKHTEGFEDCTGIFDHYPHKIKIECIVSKQVDYLLKQKQQHSPNDCSRTHKYNILQTMSTGPRIHAMCNI